MLDFGVCKLDVHDGESLTTTGEAVGTIAYMAPEQIRGASRVDERADLYAFAMVVFETLCGRLAYDASGSIRAHRVQAREACQEPAGPRPRPHPGRARRARGPVPGAAARQSPGSAAELLRQWRELGPATLAPRPSAATLHTSEPPTETGLTAAPTLPSTAHVRRGVKVGVLVAGAAVVVSGVVLAVGLTWGGASAVATPAPPPGASVAAVEPSAPLAAPLDLPATVVSADPAAASDAPAAPDAAAPAATTPVVRPRVRRFWPAAASPRKAPAGPQIVTEPRY